MKYLPLENITYNSKLSPEEIIKVLNQNLEPYQTFRITGFGQSKKHKLFEGEISNSSFNIRRIIGYRNSFLPAISGTIEKDREGSKIIVKMRLHNLVLGFMILWFGGVIFALLAFSSSTLFTGTFNKVSLIPIGMLIFGYALVLGGFKYESIKSKKCLAELFDSK